MRLVTLLPPLPPPLLECKPNSSKEVTIGKPKTCVMSAPTPHVSYLPADAAPSITRQVAEGLYVIILKGDRDTASMALVSSNCTATDMAAHLLEIKDHPDVRLDMVLEEGGTEPALVIENRWVLIWSRSYKLMVGDRCALELVNPRQQIIVIH